MENSFLFNPFYRIAGWASLLVGALVCTLTFVCAYFTGTHMVGMTQIDFARDADLGFYLLEHIIAWGTVSLALYLLSLGFSSSKIRAVDVFGTLLMARVPLLIVAVLRFIPMFQSFLYQSWQMYFLQNVFYVSSAWAVLLMYHGYKVSTNMKNNALMVTFIAGLLISEVSTHLLIRLLTS